MLAASPASAQDDERCRDRFADASTEFRIALYQSDPLHQDNASANEALSGFLTIWNGIIEQWETCQPHHLPIAEEATRSLFAIKDVAAKSSAEIRHGRLNQAHLTLRQIRPLLADLRRAEDPEIYIDHLDAFDDKLAETADDDFDDNEISPDQFVQLCEQVGVLGYLEEKMEKKAPTRWADDPTFLDALEDLSRQIRGLKITVFRGQRDPIRAALADLRRNFDHFYLLYG
jgi:hypothetical protein